MHFKPFWGKKGGETKVPTVGLNGRAYDITLYEKKTNNRHCRDDPSYQKSYRTVLGSCVGRRRNYLTEDA